MDLTKLNDMQREAVLTTEGPVLIIAGAGTGKTMTLVHRLAYLIEKGVPPSAILLLTFTNKAANEMKKRACGMIGEAAGQVTACTYHSFCVRMLRIFATEAGLDRNFTIINGTEEQDAVRMVMSELGIRATKTFPKPADILSVISASVNRQIPIQSALVLGRKDFSEWEKAITAISRRLASYKKENNFVNYDDMLVLFNRMLESCPDVRRRISRTYDYIMVDEYQDTNKIQDDIVWNLRRENNNIAVVGDDMQSLYGFRGAEVKNILGFPKRWEGCKTIMLTENYRSTQKILDLSNQVVKQATEGFPKSLTGLLDGEVQPYLVSTYDQAGEAQTVLRLVEETHRRGVPLHGICVLYRSSFQVSRLEAMLAARHIPYEKYGGQKLVDHEYVKDILAYLRLLMNPKDVLAWFRVLQNFEGIGEVNARMVALACQEEGIGALHNKKYSRRKYAPWLLALEQELTAVTSLGFPETFNHLVQFYKETKEKHILSMETDLQHKEEYMSRHKAGMRFLDSLAAVAQGYGSMVRFLDDITLENGNPDVGNGDGDRLILSTIHSAKGLEFSTVFILDCVDGICPSTSAIQVGTTEDNEELRCFYVAVTRAKERLYLMQPFRIQKFGRFVIADPSHFLEGMPEGVLGSLRD